MKIKKWIPLIIIISVFFIAWFLGLPHYFNFETFKAHQLILEQFISNHLVLSILIYMAIYIITVAFTLPVATFMTLVGGFLFGQWVGVTAVVISATLGACVLFLSAKMASQDLLSKKIGGAAKKMQEGFQENALSYLLTLRLIPLFPFFIVNLAAALFQIPLKTFVLGTFFGIIPGAFVYVSIGIALREVIRKPEFSPHIVLNPKILIALIGLGILSLLPVFYKYLKEEAT